MIRVSCHPHAVTDAKGVTRTYWRAAWRDGSGRLRHKNIGNTAQISKGEAARRCRDLEAKFIAEPGRASAGRAPTLGEWLTRHLESRGDLKDGTRQLYSHTFVRLESYFGANLRIDRITRGEAAAWRNWLTRQRSGRGNESDVLSEDTVCRMVRNAKSCFRQAVDEEIIPSNPFDRLRATPPVVTKDWAYIDAAATDRLLRACPNAGWRCLFALARMAGLRRGEPLRLTWADVDWEDGFLHVKPEADRDGRRHEGTKQRVRVVPISEELGMVLREAQEAASPGTVRVCEGVSSSNLNRQAVAIIERAGIDAYAKPFHTLRKCCLSDWCERFAPAVVAEISGDRVETLMRHYVRARKSTVRAQMGTYQTLSTMQAEMEALKRENARLQGQIEGKSNPASAPS